VTSAWPLVHAEARESQLLLEVRDNGIDREIDAALEVHRVHAGGDGLGTAFPAIIRFAK
jgi:hypothetical protein